MIDYIGPLTLGLIPAFLILDFFHRQRRYKAPKYWRIRALAVTVATFYGAGYVALFWASVLGDFHLIDGSPLGMWGGAIAGILLYELFHYWYHRSAHQIDWLWRMGHQMHHSAESLDTFGAYYLHPLDNAMFTTIASMVFYPILGLTPEAGILGAFFLTFCALFQHASFKTPEWLGYIIQRPESHSVHHAKGVHRYNYSDLPLWDMIFGTFRNPREFQPEQGFYPGASSRIGDMLIFRDVSTPKPDADSVEPAQAAEVIPS